MGFYYTIEKSENTKGIVYWKCEKTKTCKARASSVGMKQPLTIIRFHSHAPNIERKEVIFKTEKLKDDAIVSNSNPRFLIREYNKNLSDDAAVQSKLDDALRQIIHRQRNKLCDKGPNPQCVSEINISIDLQFTHKNEKFFWDDNLNNDGRILIFTTGKNLVLLSTYRDWFIDGTFSIAPVKLFKQVFTIHASISRVHLVQSIVILRRQL